MANASKKKANQAKKEAASLYKPLLLVLNAAYVLIRGITIYYGRTFTLFDVVNSLICWGFMYYSYLGICEDFAHKAGWNKSSADTALAGGHSLDLLAFTLIVQFGALWSSRVWYGLFAIPIGFAYKLYTTFRGAASSLTGGSKGTSTSTSISAPDDGYAIIKVNKSRRKAI